MASLLPPNQLHLRLVPSDRVTRLKYALTISTTPRNGEWWLICEFLFSFVKSPPQQVPLEGSEVDSALARPLPAPLREQRLHLAGGSLVLQEAPLMPNLLQIPPPHHLATLARALQEPQTLRQHLGLEHLLSAHSGSRIQPQHQPASLNLGQATLPVSSLLVHLVKALLLLQPVHLQ